ncbi:transcription termination factor Rho [Clostridium neonatale]|uniref:transcription termination factor Rho n=1 Tax=Clostridium neonatale TaxID=137838 RepID=UPI00291BD5E3|nr:Transcription termination factor [Clostridium neonatale]
MTKQDYEKMTLTKLKEVAKEIGIKNISKFKKDDLIEEILKVSPNSIEKEGVVLRESISPKPTTISTENVEIKNSSNSYNKEKRIVENIKNSREDIKRDSDQEEKKERVKERINEASVVSGILEIQENNNFGFLRCKNYLTSSEDVYVSPSQIRRFNLRTGDEVQGKVREAKEGEKFKALLYVESVNGENPEKAIGRKNFETLIPIYPKERLRLETSNSNDLSSRLMDIICPIGKGQRGLIVAPPKAGKTTLLKKIAQNISKNYPDIKLIVLLIDERPEEVTDMMRSINGDVVYSTFDEEPQNHAKVSRMVLERAKRMLEQGKDVVILMDSITRLSRAYNLTITPTGRTLSGGLDPGALIMPKKFFGAARNIEEGGSLTILATALVETGSRMDDMIFEEFKGTGNMEVHLDRRIQERRIFPAIDIYKSGTRKEDLILSKEEQEVSFAIRRNMYNDGNVDDITENLINMLSKTKNNSEFINTFSKK